MRAEASNIHPYFQLVIFILLAIGTFLTRDQFVLLGGYIIVLLLIITAGQTKLHLKTLVVANLPFLGFLLLVYGLILKNPVLQNGLSGINFSVILFLKITIVTSLIQYIMMDSADQLLFLLKKIKVGKGLLVIIVSSFSVWKGFILRADQIYTARLSRGYLKNRNFFSRLKQLPSVIKPLFTGALLVALERSASWKQRNFFLELDKIDTGLIPRKNFSALLGTIFLSVSVVWVALVITIFF